MQKILSVSELTSGIKNFLEGQFPAVSVRGEISNFKEQSSGHLYFTLKDAGAQLSAVLFRGNARDLKQMPKNGDQVVVHGEINVYAPRGNYQIIIRKLEYQGQGELLLQWQQLKAKLEAQGWFESSRKKPLPKFPKTIGVVTSPTGSVIQDILNILSRRFAGFHLILNPVKVQGEGAAAEIAQAIEQFNRHNLADLLIVGRGGGSLEDLWAFNEEKVAAAIYHSKIPIISAVGHETDFCIADFVADLRAPTPSAAAEIATLETSQTLQQLAQTKARLKTIVTSTLRTHQQRTDDHRSDLSLTMHRVLSEKKLRLLALQKQSLALRPDNRIAAWKKILDTAQKRKILDQQILDQIHRRSQKLAQLASHLRGIDPKNLLTKGYCILFQEKNDSVILSTREINEQDPVRLRMHDGTLHLTVTGKK